MTTQIDLTALLSWSEPKEISTARGRRILRKASATEAFWKVWRSDKSVLQAAGISCGKDRTGNWEACWWQPVSEEQAAKENASVAASKATDAQVEIPVPEGLNYLSFQKAGIAFIRDRPATLLGDEMGLGKTVQAIGLINVDIAIRKVLVICPASLKINWKRELDRWLVEPRKVAVQVSNEPWAGSYADVVILNYDIAGKFERQLTETQWDLFICDECHALKNPKAARTRVVLGCSAYKDRATRPGITAKRRVFMSGTPIVNRPVELFPLLHALAPREWPNFFAYAKRYCGAVQTRYGLDTSGASNLDELHQRLRSSIMVRRLKKDVLTELPPKRRQIIELLANSSASLVQQEREAHEAHEAALIELKARVEAAALADDQEEYVALAGQLKKSYSAAFEEISKLRHQVALAKLPLVVEHVREAIEEQSKVIVFAHHRDVIDQLQAEFGAQAVKLYGGMDTAEKDAAVQAFQENPEIKVFIGSITAAGVGLTLTAASHVIMAELDWRPGIVTQAEDRAHRIGQVNPVLVQHLVLEGSLDARMVKFIVRKQEIIDKALDKGSALVQGTVPVLTVEVGSVLDKADQQPPEVLKASDDLRELVHSGLKRLAGMDWDHAAEQNGIGFNKFDGAFGHALAERSKLSDKMVWAGVKLCVKYRGQLGESFGTELARLRKV